MQIARGLRLLPLPAAIVLGTVLACSSGGPTSVEQVQAGPLFAVTKDPVDDLEGSKKKVCPGGYSLLNVDIGTQGDANQNGRICVKTTGPGPKK